MRSEESKRKQQASQKKIHKETLERFNVYFKKGEKQIYKDFAKANGLSLNALIIQLLKNAIK